MRRCGSRLCFTLEPRHALGVARKRLGQNFQGAIAPELGILRAVNLSHATRSDSGGNFVGAQVVARLESHRSPSIEDRTV